MRSNPFLSDSVTVFTAYKMAGFDNFQFYKAPK